ncbi:MAG: xylulose kinase, partial [Planctomycetaceae bacterium]|nr:xylulose kinase [Planctomycetaceae bacterium]
MAESLRFIPEDAILTGWDFSTGAVKCLAFDLKGNVLAESRFPTDLWMEKDGTIELNLLQLEGQARQTLRDITAKLRQIGKLEN